MAIYRNVKMSFWTDTKVIDDFTPEDKYFYLYLMTNPHTNLSGCYEISIRQIAIETGYSRDTIDKLLDRMEKVHGVIRFSKETKEVLILKWNEYNWSSSEKLDKPLFTEIEKIKNPDFKAFLEDIFESRDTVSIPYPYGIDTTDTDIYKDNINLIKDIIGYLNTKASKKYSYKTENTKRHINARLSDGYTIDDFKKVIDTKCEEWLNTKWEKYLCPDTLFRPSNFEKYLNQSPAKAEQVSSNIDYSEFLRSGDE